MEYPITAGQIVLQGDGHRKLPPVKADYLLRYSESLPIAVVEAKDESHTPGAGLQQAMGYAEKQGLYFAYSSNGHGWVEWDFTTNTQRCVADGPVSQPGGAVAASVRVSQRSMRTGRRIPCCNPTGTTPAGIKQMRYYQEVAVNRVLEAILKGQRRILINLATGTGKTFIAFQIVWKLIKSGYFANKRVLFLADRVVLRDQAYNAFELFKEAAGDRARSIDGGTIPAGRQDLLWHLPEPLCGRTQTGCAPSSSCRPTSST